MQTMNQELFHLPLDRMKQKHIIVLTFSQQTLKIKLLYHLDCVGNILTIKDL